MKLSNICRPATERSRSGDIYVWIDRMLTLADTAAEVNGPDAALDIIHEALAEAPDHPGLLEAEVRFALAASAYAEAADTRGRLARFYISQDEKVHQLTQAALILFDTLQDADGARNILREAKRRNPGHAEANDVLRYILNAVGDPATKDVKSPSKEPSPTTVAPPAEAQENTAEDALDAQIAGGQWESALETVNGLLVRFPDRLTAHRKRLDILTRLKRWGEALAASESYFNAATNREERRSIVFRAAGIAEEVLKDSKLSIAWLERLTETGRPLRGGGKANSNPEGKTRR